MSIRKASVALMMVAGFLSPSLASALCTQADLTGRWSLSLVAYTKEPKYQAPIYLQCEFVIAADRTLTGSCFDSTGASGPIAAGFATMTGTVNCNMSTRFGFGSANYDIVFGTISRDKISIAATGNRTTIPYSFGNVMASFLKL